VIAQFSEVPLLSLSMHPQHSWPRWGWLMCLVLVMSMSGCRLTSPPPNVVQGRAENAEPSGVAVGRELDMLSLPLYRIEPPDVLTIQANRVIPRSPYRLRPLDSLQINVEGTLPDQPINGIYIVEPSGLLTLGPGYGKAMVGNLALEEAAEMIESQLKRVLRNPQVSLSLAEAAGMQQINGEHQVGPDGRINLGIYGMLPVTGLSIDEATAVINRHLERFLDNPQVSVDVFSFASKKYYVISAGAGNGDTIQSFPITGNETVLTALSQIQGISQFSNKKMWIARPTPNGEFCEQRIPVEYDSIVRGGSAATNYQLFPGDRLYIEEDHMLALSNRIGRVTEPFERVLGFLLLGSNTLQGLRRFPQGNFN
jgi:polysaccharide export outer membrane protein